MNFLVFPNQDAMRPDLSWTHDHYRQLIKIEDRGLPAHSCMRRQIEINCKSDSNHLRPEN